MLRALPRGVAASFERRLRRRRRTSLPEHKIKCLPLAEGLQKVRQFIFGQDADPHRGFRAFDRSVSKHLTSDLDAFYGFLTASQLTFRRARSLGLQRILDMPIAHWGVGRGIMHEEKQLWGVTSKYRDGYSWDPERYDVDMDEEVSSADLIVAGSEFVRESLVLAGVDRNKVLLNPYGVDLALFPPKSADTSYHAEKGRDPRRRFRIVSVGSINLRKGSVYLLDAARTLGPSVEVAFAGRLDLPQTLVREKWSDNVKHIPHVPFYDIPRLLRWADAFVFPTLLEGSSLASYEALASGVPVVTTPNCGSVVRDNVDGIEIPIRSPAAIVGAIERLRDDGGLWCRLSLSARERAKEFTWAAHGNRLVARLRLLTQGNVSRSSGESGLHRDFPFTER